MKAANIKYNKIEANTLDASNVGDPIMRDDRGYKEYGIITGFVNNLVLVHFGSNWASLRLREQDLYHIVVTI